MSVGDQNVDLSHVPRYRGAYESMRNAIESVSEQDFVGITLDIPSAIYTVIGRWALIQTLRPEFAKNLPSFDLAQFDSLETVALALGHAQTEYKTLTAPAASLVELSTKLVDIRAVLLADVSSLIVRGLLPENAVSNLQGPNGYKNAVADVFELANLLKVNKDKVAARTSVTAEELDAAENLADQVSSAIAQRGHGAVVAAEAVRNRQAAYTLFINAYEEVRAGVQYLRRKEGDADTYTPSLFAGRGGRPLKKDNADNTNQAQTKDVHAATKDPTTLPTAVATPAVATPAVTAPAVAAPAVTTPTAEQLSKAKIAANGPFMS